MRALRNIQFILWTAVAFAIIAMSVYLLVGSSARRVSSSISAADIGGPFNLTTHKGAEFSLADLRGKPFAVFFGFTHCPEVCPTTLMELGSLMQKMGSESDGFVPLFVTVDPERDTVEFLAQYLRSFDPRIIALTGTVAQVGDMLKAYRVYSRKVPTQGNEYTMDHTATVYLMDSQGRLAGTLDFHESEDTRLAKLRRLIKGP